jgi:hypothetical protein
VKVKQLVTTSLLSFCCVVCPHDKRFDLEERHFALMEISAIPTKARAYIFRSEILDPTHASLRCTTSIIMRRIPLLGDMSEPTPFSARVL